MTIQSSKFSKEDRELIFKHFDLAIKVIFGLGICILALGYINFKPFMTLMGALLAFVCICIQFIFLKIELNRNLKIKRIQIDEKTKLIRDLLQKANTTILPIKDELSKRTTSTLASDFSSSLNYLSLERLIDSLSARLEDIDHFKSSNSLSSIEKAEELLETNLVFSNKSSNHLMEHEMPDMPPSTWYDSLNFLLNKVTADIKNFKRSQE